MEIDSSLSTMDRTPQKFGKFRIIKNLVVMSISMMLNSAAYDGLSMLQSTLNQEIGTASQAIAYATQCLSSLILPKNVVQRFGCKCVFVTALALFLPYVAANFYPKWYTLIFTAMFLGVAFSIEFASQTLYFNENVILYCRLDSTKKDNNSDQSCVPEEPSTKEMLNCCNENHEKNHRGKILGKNMNVTRNVEEAIPHGSTCCQVLSKRNTCPDVNTKMVILKDEDLGKSEYSLNNTISNNDFLAKIINLENAESFSAINPAFTTSDELTKNTDIKTSNLVTSNHDSFDVQQEGKFSRNCCTIDVQHERNKPRETDYQRRNIESVTARFFGANGLVFHSAQVWGNLISFYVLQIGDEFYENTFCACGATLCRNETACFAEEKYDGTKDGNYRYLLSGISLATAVFSVLLGYFLIDPLETERDPSVKFSLDNLMATFRQCKVKTQLCLVPISLYIGMLQGFYTADFTKSYIACALGRSRVGLVTAVYGLSCALSSPLAGFLIKYTGRIPVFLLMEAVNLSVLFYLLVWSPNSDDRITFYAIASLLGVVTGTQWSQIPAFHGILFKKDEEAAFASYYLFNSLGWSVSFALSDSLCTSRRSSCTSCLLCHASESSAT